MCQYLGSVNEKCLGLIQVREQPRTICLRRGCEGLSTNEMSILKFQARADRSVWCGEERSLIGRLRRVLTQEAEPRVRAPTAVTVPDANFSSLAITWQQPSCSMDTHWLIGTLSRNNAGVEERHVCIAGCQPVSCLHGQQKAGA